MRANTRGIRPSLVRFPFCERNLAHKHAGSATVMKRKRSEYRDFAGEYCDVVMHMLEDQGIAYRFPWFEEAGGTLRPAHRRVQWRHHQALEVDGLIHDLWAGEPLPVVEYCRAMFPGQDVLVEYPAEESDDAGQ